MNDVKNYTLEKFGFTNNIDINDRKKSTKIIKKKLNKHKTNNEKNNLENYGFMKNINYPKL
tara:strand:- start:171 stop:353 length:183 start_codon:yes stop_codon:yes gene_type:complete